MRKGTAAFIGTFVRSLALCAALGVFAFSNGALWAANRNPSDVVPIPLTRSDDNKLLLRAKVPGGYAYMVLDTGAPIACVDKSKNSLFHFEPSPKGAPEFVIMNGERDRLAVIPQMEMGGVTAKNVPVALADISSVNPARQRCDGILSLADLCHLHAVLDFGSRALFIHPHPTRVSVPAGWCAIPMRIMAQHLVVPVTLRGVPTLFIVDTGSPLSIIDTALRSSQRIPVKKNYNFGLSGIHYQNKAAQLGMIPNLSIGSVSVGQTPVGVFDISGVFGPELSSLGVTGLIGGHTLDHLKAIIDCNSMQLYIKQP